MKKNKKSKIIKDGKITDIIIKNTAGTDTRGYIILESGIHKAEKQILAKIKKTLLKNKLLFDSCQDSVFEIVE